MTHAASATRRADTGASRSAVVMREPLAIYLNDHLMGATSGSELARRVAKQHAQTPAGAALVRMADEIAQDRAELLRIMDDLGIPVRRYKIGIGWAVEKAGRAKTNGFLVRRAPLSSLVELESLRAGVEAKRLMWQALRASGTDRTGGLGADRLTELLHRARRQLETLEDLHLQVAGAVLEKS
ncbi:hypothetical protein ACFPA8_20565 [Streptomyces ovatisporus]|uniref:Uncharacterized protein n=1 Tax=Streptomyces ovatisporus TaxID=1128682 RepID=A0ABV9ABV9_9ACTN